MLCPTPVQASQPAPHHILACQNVSGDGCHNLRQLSRATDFLWTIALLTRPSIKCLVLLVCLWKEGGFGHSTHTINIPINSSFCKDEQVNN